MKSFVVRRVAFASDSSQLAGERAREHARGRKKREMYVLLVDARKAL